MPESGIVAVKRAMRSYIKFLRRKLTPLKKFSGGKFKLLSSFLAGLRVDYNVQNFSFLCQSFVDYKDSILDNFYFYSFQRKPSFIFLLLNKQFFFIFNFMRKSISKDNQCLKLFIWFFKKSLFLFNTRFLYCHFIFLKFNCIYFFTCLKFLSLILSGGVVKLVDVLKLGRVFKVFIDFYIKKRVYIILPVFVGYFNFLFLFIRLLKKLSYQDFPSNSTEDFLRLIDFSKAVNFSRFKGSSFFREFSLYYNDQKR